MSRLSTYHPSSTNPYSSSSHNTSTHSTALQSRIAAKRLELENLRQLRDLSAQLATQMKLLDQKLSTLKDGTEAVACVLANWEGVLNVIGMAGQMVGRVVGEERKQREDGDGQGEEGKGKDENGGDVDVDGDGARGGQVAKLPETLVRIPVQIQTQPQDKDAVKDSSTGG